MANKYVGRKEKRIRRLKIAGVFLAVILILLSPVFRITKTEISQINSYDEKEIEEFLAPYKGKNGFLTVFRNSSFSQSESIFSMELTEAEKKMLFEFPYLDGVRIKYVFPNRLRVSATERTGSFVTELEGSYYLIDTKGFVLSILASREEVSGMPLVVGINAGSMKLGSYINESKDAKTDSAISVCSMMRQLSMEKYIDIVDVSDYNNIRMYCAPKLTILFGSSTDTGNRLLELKKILDDRLNGYSDGVLDMSSGNTVTFVKNSPEEK